MRLVQLAHVVEQQVAHLAAPTGAFGDAGKVRHQRRLQRIGQQDRLVVLARQRLADPPARGQLQRAVAEREAQGLAHFGHAFEQRPAPFGRQHVDLTLRVLLLQALEQGLRHYHVADPTGANDQYSHALSRNAGGKCSTVSPLYIQARWRAVYHWWWSKAFSACNAKEHELSTPLITLWERVYPQRGRSQPPICTAKALPSFAGKPAPTSFCGAA
ncbi:hypothetical protein PS623_04662 [Pseudomonas fluorescens]|nr:hypothetical protein PS623_04662 [Pseudomonas fluorescens]